MPTCTTAFRYRTVLFAAGLALGLSTLALAEAADDKASGAEEKKALLEGPQVEQKPTAAGPMMGGGAGFAEPKGNRPGDGRLMEAALEGIELSPEQKEKLREVMGEVHAQRRQWNKEHGESFGKLKAEVDAARKAGDRPAAHAAQQKIMELRKNQLTPQQISAKMREVLTAEQQVQYDKNTAAIREQMRKQNMDQSKDRAGKSRENTMDGKRPQGEKKQRPSDSKPKGEKKLDL